MLAPSESSIAGFRLRLVIAMMLVVAVITAIGIYFAQKQLTAGVKQNLEREFKGEVAFLNNVQQVRHALLAERCRALVQKPRIHAALEDNALDLLYPSAGDELQDLMDNQDESETPAARSLRATFYRFLNEKGKLIPAPHEEKVGQLQPDEEARLALNEVSGESQTGYLTRSDEDGGDTVDDVVAVPIISTETTQPIAMMVVGFRPPELGEQRTIPDFQSGIWMEGRLHLSKVGNSARETVAREVSLATASSVAGEKTLLIGNVPHLLFFTLLNPNSLFPPAYEICIYPLNDLIRRQRHLRWQILGAGTLMLLGGFGASHFASARLAQPVAKLAVDSAEDRSERYRAEAALKKTSRELQRSARFSANTSHQLKTPMTVLRAGLEELRTKENITSNAREEISALIHQTFRITNIVEDLLLLSQMDAGRLQINFNSLNLTHLLEAQLDDLSALPDHVDVEVESHCPEIHISGEKRYVSIILQNLLENALKYNRRGGRIQINCREEGKWALLSIANTGLPIPSEAQEHIFERFHRGIGEGITGHGLGLNLARELTRLHGGDLRLIQSVEDWTKFEVRLRSATHVAAVTEGGVP